MGNLEKLFGTELKRNKNYLDMEREAIIRLENTIKLQEDTVELVGIKF